jgi:hypothetical protein
VPAGAEADDAAAVAAAVRGGAVRSAYGPVEAAAEAIALLLGFKLKRARNSWLLPGSQRRGLGFDRMDGAGRVLFDSGG